MSGGENLGQLCLVWMSSLGPLTLHPALFLLVLHLLLLEPGKKESITPGWDVNHCLGSLCRNLVHILLILLPLLIFLLLSISNSWYPPVAAARSVARRNFIDLHCWKEHLPPTPHPHLLCLLLTLDALHRFLLEEMEEVGGIWPAWLPAQRLASR